MIDGNTAALSRHMNEQDEADRLHSLYAKEATDHLEARLMQSEPGKCWGQYCDDPTHYNGMFQHAIERAIANCDTAELGRLIMFGIGNAGRSLITDHEIAARVRELGEKE